MILRFSMNFEFQKTQSTKFPYLVTVPLASRFCPNIPVAYNLNKEVLQKHSFQSSRNSRKLLEHLLLGTHFGANFATYNLQKLFAKR